MNKIVGLLRDAFDYLIPRRCVICNAQLDDIEENHICVACLAKIPQTGYHTRHNNPFEERFAGRFPFDRGTAVFFYERGATLSSLVHDFKYHNLPGVATELGREMYRRLKDTDFFDGIDIIVPVGTNFIRKLTRGYNQTLYLAEGLGEEADIEVVDCLEMRRYHRTQTRRTIEERKTSVENIFRVKSGYDLTDCTLLLIDDICTTGATMQSAAEALLAHTPSLRLRLLTLACTL